MFFFFNDTATTEIYTLSLHDALPISAWAASRLIGHGASRRCQRSRPSWPSTRSITGMRLTRSTIRSEEHTSELQSQSNLVCRLLLEKKQQRAAHGPKSNQRAARPDRN